MFMAFFSWWYGEGWRRQSSHVSDRIITLMDTFSIDLIIRTLFMPFRQIDAERVNGPIGVQLRAFVDKTVSRFIGAIVRLVVLIAGCISIIVGCVLGLLYLVLWPLLPLLPIAGLIVSLGGVNLWVR